LLPESQEYQNPPRTDIRSYALNPQLNVSFDTVRGIKSHGLNAWGY
jgi:hypothetical protein